MTQPSPPTWLDAFFGSGYKVVVNGTNVFPSRLKLDLEGVGFSIVDDPTNDQTIITFTNGQTTTTTTASFVMPAVGANVTIPVLSTASLAAGLTVFVAGAGYITVVSVTDGTHFVGQNVGATGNAASGTTIASAALVIPSGPAATGTGVSATLAASFTQPAVWQTSGETATVTVQVNPSSNAYAAGACVFVPGGGFYLVTAVPDTSHLTLGNLGAVGAVAPGTTVGSGVLVLLTGAPPPLIEVGGSAVTQRRVLDFEGFTTVDDGANDRTKIVNTSAQVTTSANFTQPAIGASVTVSVSSSTGYAAGTWATIAGGGRYTVASVPDGTHLSLVNRGGTGNAAAGTTVASGAVVSLAATEPIEVLASTRSPFSLRPVFNIMAPEFGAVGSNPTADTAGLQAAIAAASAIPGATVFIPPGPVFQVNAETTVTASIRIVGDRGSTLQAAAPIRSILRLQEDILVEEITFDGGSGQLAQWGILFNGAEHSVVDCCDFINLAKDAFRVSSKSTAAVFTAGSHTGGGPSGMTLSQPDALMCNVSTSQISIKITTGGALATATFRPSYDGGVTYDPVDQTLFADTQIALTANPVIASDSGVRISAPPGTYVLNAVYNFTGTNPTLVLNEGISIRSDCFSDNCGVVYATAGIVNDYLGLTFVTEPAGGATWTSGSQFVRFPSGGLLAKGARDGDSIRLVGAKFPLDNRKTPAEFTDTTVIACVLSDTLLAIEPVTLPTVGGTGADYAIGVGWGAGFVDPTTGKENDQLMITGGHYQRCANGFRDGSLNPGVADNIWLDNYGLVGMYIGTMFSD